MNLKNMVNSAIENNLTKFFLSFFLHFYCFIRFKNEGIIFSQNIKI